MIVIILGMHRSGTSCLAGSLQRAGLHLGEVITAAPFNRRGNRENQRIQDLNEEILVANGGSWDAPPRTVAWQPQHRAARDDILREYAGVEHWGFKDPRTLLTLDGWLEMLDDVRFVGTFRHPARVAKSLLARNRDSAERWLTLWMVYNSKLLEVFERHPFPLVDFDLDDAHYQDRLERLRLELGLPGTISGLPAERPREQLDDAVPGAFFDPGLRKRLETSDIPLPPDVEALYARLLDRADAG
ncbi:MAG: sulfotransferase [Gammaproteobacteria bacterium]|nr:sulfotransferase [Gammaproteobacteria bacterium]